MITVIAARREGVDAEERALEACAIWADADGARRWGHDLGWLGMLRYRQGRRVERGALGRRGAGGARPRPCSRVGGWR